MNRKSDYEQIVQYIYDIPKFTKKASMDQTRALMAYFGNPQKDFGYIHIAGTNGKGSVSAMLERSLRECGLRTGLFTSPHLVKINERICVNGEMISDADFVLLFKEVKSKVDTFVDGGAPHPTFFEWIYLMAMLWFKRQRVDAAVIETGLGGRLDATNVIGQPLLTGITSIGFDHMQYLGHTIEAIAGEKAGIIKPGVPVIYDDTVPEASGVIAAAADAIGAPAIGVGADRIRNVRMTEDGYAYELKLEDMHKRNSICALNTACSENASYTNMSDAILPLHVSMLGHYQLQNSAIAAMMMHELICSGKISDLLKKRSLTQSLGDKCSDVDTMTDRKDMSEALYACTQRGISGTSWSGRMERLRSGLYVDGAHNDAGIRALIRTLRERFDEGDVYLLFAVAEDKDYTRMIKDLCEDHFLAGVVVTAINNERRADIDTIADLFEQNGQEDVRRAGDIAKALNVAMQMSEGHNLCCCGSLYLVGSIKEYFGNNPSGVFCSANFL